MCARITDLPAINNNHGTKQHMVRISAVLILILIANINRYGTVRYEYGPLKPENRGTKLNGTGENGCRCSRCRTIIRAIPKPNKLY